MTTQTAQSARISNAITRLRNTAAFEHERREFFYGVECMCGQPWPCEEQQHLRDDADAVSALLDERDELRGLLGSIWLYVKWRWVTKQLTTEQKELWADAVDAKVMAGQIEDGEEPHPVAERWWRNDCEPGTCVACTATLEGRG